MTEVLFTVTKESLETGMRGYPVGYCTTSFVDSEKGLFYCGYPVRDIAFWNPKEVIYLLYSGKKGTSDEVGTFIQDLKRRMTCSPQAMQHIAKLPKKGHPMQLLPAALLILGMYEVTGDFREDALNLIAKVPQLAAAVINHHAGWGETPPPKPELGYIENFTHMLQMPKKSEKLTEVLSLFSILHFDHGGGNLSTFVGKAVASGLEDVYGSMAAALLALAGPRHGRANQDCLEFVELVAKQVGADATEARVEELIRRRLAEGELIFGFGHAVLRVEDPRATLFYDYASRHFPDHPLVKIALKLRTAGTKVLTENPKISDPHPNVDAISGTLLSAAGFHYPDYFTVLFGLARTVGIALQIVYERCEARGGKGTPIVRPRYLYKDRTKK